MKKFLLTCLMATPLLLGSIDSYAKKWDAQNNPNLMNESSTTPFENNYYKFPKSASLTNKPWTDDYWPTYKRGIAQRWKGDLVIKKHPNESNESFEKRKKQKAYISFQNLAKMSEQERDKLSPAEKYDIYRGDYKYTITKSEWSRTDPKAPRWEGLCHGWAAAAMNFKEPNPCRVKVAGMNGIEGFNLPFSSSDIKALITLLQGNFNPNAEEYFAGTRCDDKIDDVKDWPKSIHAQDLNAGSFHIILSNLVGLQDKGFVMDRTNDQEVWNQPVEAYKIISEVEQAPDLTQAAPGTVKEVKIVNEVSYTIEISPQHKALNKGDRSSFVVNQEYEYILELDASGNILGGRWVSDQHPDFVWNQSTAEFTGIFAPLKEIYELSIKE